MKRFVSIIVLAAAFVAVSSSAAFAQHVKLTATLYGSNETPAPGLNTGAFATAEVGLDVANREVTVNMEVFNLPTGTTGGHIHAGAPGTAGPVILDFAVPSGRTGDFSINVRLGQAQFRARPEIGINTLDDAIQAIAGGNTYINIHTTQYAGGEIRGQLTRRDGQQ